VTLILSYIPAESDDQRFFGPNIADRDIAVCDPRVSPAEQFDPMSWPRK